MPSDYLLEIDTVQGEAQDKIVKNGIEVDSFSWGLTHPGSMAAGTGGATGKASFQDLHFTTKVGKHSATVGKLCANGSHVNKATLHVRKATGQGGQMDYYKAELKEVMVSSYQSGGHSGGDSLPTDQSALNYGKIEFVYKPQNTKTGALEADQTFKYDVKAQQE